MIHAAPPELAGASAERKSFPWRLALARGLVAFAVVAAAGQVVPLLMELFGAGLAARTALELGWLYALAFHGVGIELVRSGAPEVQLALTFLSGTAFAAFILHREGRRVAARARGGPRAAALWGAAIAPTYAVPFVALTPLLHLDLLDLPTLPRVTSVEGVAWQAFLLPFALAVVAGGVGGLLVALPRGSLLASALMGGWRMLVAALALSIVALLVIAALRPAGLATYARVVGDGGVRRAGLLLAHQALALPNLGIDLLVPSMGGCVGIRGATFAVPVACPGRLPRVDVPGLAIALARAMAGTRPPPPFSRSMPAGYLALALVPAVATIWGGWSAASRVDGRDVRLAAGVASGVVFALLVLATAWLALITLRVAVTSSFGAAPSQSASLALAWGVAGGVLGALLARAQAPEVPDADPAPPRPTSE